MRFEFNSRDKETFKKNVNSFAPRDVCRFSSLKLITWYIYLSCSLLLIRFFMCVSVFVRCSRACLYMHIFFLPLLLFVFHFYRMEAQRVAVDAVVVVAGGCV